MNDANISAHHGYINCENELFPTISLLKSFPEIDIVEIDFIYHEGTFVSSHDYDEKNITKGTGLVTWLQRVIRLKKILWIDIKDAEVSSILEWASIFNVKALFNVLDKQRKIFSEEGIRLEDWVIISSQYEHIHRKLIKNTVYTIVYDLPFDDAYFYRKIIPDFLEVILLNCSVRESIENKCTSLPSNSIVALDISFFESMEQLTEFIIKIDIQTFIIYSLNQGTTIDVKNKKIIYQYNYVLTDY